MSGILKSILARVDLDGSGFEKNALKVENQAEKLGRKITGELAGLGAGLVAGFGIASLISSADALITRIGRLSREFRINTDTAQRWEIAANKIGESAELFGEAFNRAKKAREAALSGDVGARNAFGAFGISMEQLRDASKDTETIINEIVSATSGRRILDSEDVAGMELFGRSGAKVLSAMQELKEVGKIKLIDSETIQAFEQLKHDAHSVERSVKNWAIDAAGKSWVGLKFLWKAAGVELDVLRGKMTRAQADAAKMAIAGSITGDGKAATAAATAPVHHVTNAVVDLHKDDLEIMQKRQSLAEKILQNNLAEMTTVKKIAALKKEIASEDDKATRALYEGNDLEAIKHAQLAEERRAQLIAEEKKKGKDLNVDSLARMGGFVGGAEQALAVVQRQQLDAQRATVKISEKILKALQTSGAPAVRESLIQ